MLTCSITPYTCTDREIVARLHIDDADGSASRHGSEQSGNLVAMMDVYMTPDDVEAIRAALVAYDRATATRVTVPELEVVPA